MSVHEDEITTRKPVLESEPGDPEAIMHSMKVARLMAVVLSGKSIISNSDLC